MTTMQGDYRIFVGAFLGDELAAQIQALRLAHDRKTAQITAPHVTLAGTYWRSGAPVPASEAAASAALQAACARLAPFALELGGIAGFGRVPHVIYLAVAPTPALLAVRTALLAALGPDKHGQFTPHLTLAMRLPAAASAQLYADLLRSPWHTQRWQAPIRQLQLMQRGPADPAWRTIDVLPLTDQTVTA